MMLELSSSPEPIEASSEEQQPTTSKRKKNKNKRRFNDEQVRSLETIFQSETKLNPIKKVQVARDLGLQPQQVAIWFQNKRARWKSKQIEKNYRALKANYDNLKARIETAKKEKDTLLVQLQELQSQLLKTHGGNSSEDFAGDGVDKSRTYMDRIGEVTPEPSMLEEELQNQRVLFLGDDPKNENIAYLGQEIEPQLLNVNEQKDNCLASQARWCSFDSGTLFDQSSTSSHWWDPWT